MQHRRERFQGSEVTYTRVLTSLNIRIKYKFSPETFTRISHETRYKRRRLSRNCKLHMLSGAHVTASCTAESSAGKTHGCCARSRYSLTHNMQMIVPTTCSNPCCSDDDGTTSRRCIETRKQKKK